MLILLFLILLLPILVLYFIYQLLKIGVNTNKASAREVDKIAYEGQFVFKGIVNPVRASLLRDIFGIYESNLQSIHFDGKYFHLKEGMRHFSEFNTLRHLESQNVTIKNTSLPHTKRWLHSRISGGPDLRYRYNPETYISTKYMFRLEGTFQFDFVSYGIERDLNQVIENFNLFLAAANKFDLETIFTEYEMAFRNLNLIDQECVNNLRQISDNETALSASERLSLQGMNASSNVEIIQSKLKEIEQQLLSKKSLLSQRQTSANLDFSKLLQKVKDIKAIHKYTE